LTASADSSEAVYVCLIGGAATARAARAWRLAGTLTEAAESALGRKLDAYRGPLPKPGGGRLIRGCSAAARCARRRSSILQRSGRLSHRTRSGLGRACAANMRDAHILIDLGDDAFTRGRPHPMIEPAARDAPLREAMADSSVGAMLLDVILGWGAHADPAGQLSSALGACHRNGPAVVASVDGTEADPQVRSVQVRKLTDAGVLVAPSNAAATAIALQCVKP
jgi:hypothetical protein